MQIISQLATALVRVYKASQLMETGSLGREFKAGGARKRFTVNLRSNISYFYTLCWFLSTKIHHYLELSLLLLVNIRQIYLLFLSILASADVVAELKLNDKKCERSKLVDLRLCLIFLL